MQVSENEIKNMTMQSAVDKYNTYFEASETTLTKEQAQKLMKKEYPTYSVNVKVAMGTGLEAWVSQDKQIIVVYINRGILLLLYCRLIIVSGFFLYKI